MKQSAGKLLSEHASQIAFRSLPREVVFATKQVILDLIAAGAAGLQAPGVDAVRGLLRHWAGRREATVWFSRFRLPAPHAAMANSILAHARDYDDTHDDAILHAGISVIPSALSVAEARGGVSGPDLLAAVAVGVDIVSRIGRAIRTPLSWMRTATLGTFGAAVAAARILGLDAEGVERALGIAYSQAAGNIQCLLDGALVKRMQPGLMVRAGVTAAYLAERKIDGARGWLDGPYGYFCLYERVAPDEEMLLGGLGDRFEVSNLSLKPYPCARDGHAALDLALELHREGLRAEVIRKIEVRCSRFVLETVGLPIGCRQNPVAAAIASLPYQLAVALIHGRVSLEHFEETAIARATDVHALAERVVVSEDPEVDPRSLVPVTLRVTTDGGEIFRVAADMKGSPQRPLAWADCVEKLDQAVRYSRLADRGICVDRIVTAVDRLDADPDIRTLSDALLAESGAGVLVQ